ncbi:hypothetical protein L2D08_13225 [Domibacillus sp. PGB-M46]|uniref:DUF5388 domain-containing protein n=1 Tax=Domibacillus sp. PGB-M46 TaxID=2910255 RepID=UPI001F5874D5|nr:DUF5388 domain-containing protein [Domibacillus sp. PGB-M46]MCI2255329.1 hypothetical protein [Domibacillus sp. PGB-M46]
MSDLLKKKPNKLLNRGKQITPNTTFSLDNDSFNKPSIATDPTPPEKKETQTKRVQPGTTTVRVSTTTKEKLNGLVTLGIAESVDSLLEILVEEYQSNYLTKEQKKQYSLILDIYASRKK